MNHLLLFSMSYEMSHWKPLTAVIIAGAVVGIVCALIMKGKSIGIFSCAVVGILGALLYHFFVAGSFKITGKHTIDEIIGAIIGALVVTVFLNMVFGGKDRDKTSYEA